MNIETLSQIALNLHELPKTKSLPRLVGAGQNDRTTKEEPKALKMQSLRIFFPKFENEKKVGSKLKQFLMKSPFEEYVEKVCNKFELY